MAKAKKKKKADGPVTTRETIVAGVRALGVNPGDVLLVHSSLKSLGLVPRGAKEVIEALQEVVTEQGTLILPTLTWNRINAKNPRFDVQKARCSVGTIPETFRKMKDVTRSLHPTHSVAAWGREARAITLGHEQQQTPGGVDSPYHRIVQRAGKILFLGVTTACNTMLHCIEEWAGITESLTEEAEPLEVVDMNGKVIPVPTRRHAGRRSRFFEKMEVLYLREGIMKTGRVGPAECRLIASADMTEFTVSLLERSHDLFTHNEIPHGA